MLFALNKTLDRGIIPEPAADEPIVVDENARLSFVAWGDPQISCLSPLRSARVHNACLDLANMQGKMDALVLAGDITEYGAESEYKMMTHLLEGVGGKFDNILAVTGNHDIRLRRHGRQVARFGSFLGNTENGVANPADTLSFSREINGYKFIMMGADNAAFEASFISNEQLEFIHNELKSADRSKPVFVVNHQPLKRTNGLPVTFLGRGKWRGSVGFQSQQLRNIFEKFGNVIYITGHLHYCTSQYTYEDCGRFKAVNLPTVGVLNHGEFSKLTQGLIFSVYDDKIEVRSRVFGEGRYADGSVDNSAFVIPLGQNGFAE